MKKVRKVAFDPKIFLAKVGDGKAISKYQKDQIVFLQGDLADAVFYIQTGRIKLTVVSERGKEAVVGILEPRTLFWRRVSQWSPAAGHNGYGDWSIPDYAYQQGGNIATLHDQPEFSELFMADLLNWNSRIEEDLIDQLFNSSEKRLARVLLLLANFGKEATVEPIIGKFSQETLAEMIGTTRSRVSFFMNKFRKLGYIEYNGKLEIRSSLLNVVLYDKPEIRKNDASDGPR